MIGANHSFANIIIIYIWEVIMSINSVSLTGCTLDLTFTRFVMRGNMFRLILNNNLSTVDFYTVSRNINNLEMSVAML